MQNLDKLIDKYYTKLAELKQLKAELEIRETMGLKGNYALQRRIRNREQTLAKMRETIDAM